MPVTNVKSGWESGNLVFRGLNGNPVLTLTPQGAMFPNPTGALDYFVDLNASSAATAGAMATHDATVDGLSWATAFQLISSAIAASNTSIGLTANRWWARRNRIFVCGDGIAEDLTVLPEKCDIIGVGSDLYPFPRVIGVHIIALAKVGVRFINMGFQATGTGDLFVIPAGCHGLQFVGCTLTAASGANTKALEITDCAHVRVIGCDFLTAAGGVTGIFARAVSLEGTTSIHDFMATDNRITCAAGAFVLAAGELNGSLVARNFIRQIGANVAIVDASSECVFADNRIISSEGTQAASSFVTWNAKLAVNNILTADVVRSGLLPLTVPLTS
jgi:hypothetical protein